MKELEEYTLEDIKFLQDKKLYDAYNKEIENLTTNNIYVLKRTIKVEPAYISDLPKDIHELETLQMNMNLETINNGIDYSHLTRQIGEEIVLQKLKRRRK